MPDRGRGRISEAYLLEKSERVRKSSDGREGAVKLEKAFAAERSAASEAVRLDLSELFCFCVERGVATGVRVGVDHKVVAVGTSRSGWSGHSSAGGEETLRWERDMRRTDVGVSGSEKVGDRIGSMSNSREGVDMMESLEIERDGNDKGLFSRLEPSRTWSDEASDGSRSKSRGEPFPVEYETLASFFHSSRRCSMDIRFGNDRTGIDFKERFFGGGIDVTAKRLATDAGSALSSWRDFLASLRGVMVVETAERFF
jgi:hypothetical protein